MLGIALAAPPLAAARILWTLPLGDLSVTGRYLLTTCCISMLFLIPLLPFLVDPSEGSLHSESPMVDRRWNWIALSVISIVLTGLLLLGVILLDRPR